MNSFVSWLSNAPSLLTSPKYLKTHVNPHFVLSAAKLSWWEMWHPDSPWLTAKSIDIIDCLLTKEDVGLEFGSGRSTVWFAGRVKHITSVDHYEPWAKKVKKLLTKNKLNHKVDYNLFSNASDATNTSDGYVEIIEKFKNNSLDFCLIDGILRDRCADKILPKLKPGGVLIIDNINWFTHRPLKDRVVEDIKDDEKIPLPLWEKFENNVKGWRDIWTTNGCWDTAIWIKPPNSKK